MKRLRCLIILVILLTTVGCDIDKASKNSNDTLNNNGSQEQYSNVSDVSDNETESNKSNVQDSSNTSQNVTQLYELYYETFELIDEMKKTNILIQYPQISGMDSLELEKIINSLLKENAIHVYASKVSDGLNLQIEMQIKYFDANLISVRYAGYEHYHGSMRVYGVLYATNINLNTGELLHINDIFNDEFQKKLNRDIFKYNGSDKVLDGEVVKPNTHEYGYINADDSIITDMFEKYLNNVSDSEFYFSENALNIIVKVPSGPTAYLELIADLEDLGTCIYESSVVNKSFN